MRILVVGAGGRHRTERSIIRAARALGHEADSLEPAWYARLGPLGTRLAVRRADRFSPDFVLCTRHALGLGEAPLSRLLARRRSALWYFDAVHPLPLEVQDLARRVDETFATYGFQVEAFRALGIGSRFLPQGADPGVDFPAPGVPGDWRCDAGFIGSGQYPRRHAVLRAIAGQCRLQIRGPGWEGAPADLPVAGGTVRGAAFRAAVTGASVSIGVNALGAQADERRGGTSNRLWRVLACGGTYLGEHVPGVERFAAQGEHAFWYRTTDEAVELTRELLGDPVRRARVAEAGRRHVLAHHTYRHRLPLLLAGQDYTST